MTTAYMQTVGRMAYMWGWPLVYVYNQRNQLTKVPEPLLLDGAVCVAPKETQEVYLTFSRLFERLWLECKKRLLNYLAQKPAAVGLRSQYALRLYAWAIALIESEPPMPS
jgi:hypothetical protein